MSPEGRSFSREVITETYYSDVEREFLTRQTENVFGRYEIQTTEKDQSGRIVNSWRSVLGDKSAVVYKGDQIEQIRTRDLNTGCETIREFHADVFVEQVWCNGRLSKWLEFDSANTLEHHCTETNDTYQCQISQNGAIKREFKTIKALNSQITEHATYGRSHPYREYERTEVMEKSNGDRIERVYNMESRKPDYLPGPTGPSDERWQLYMTSEKTGRLPGDDRFKTVTHFDRHGKPFSVVLTELVP